MRLIVCYFASQCYGGRCPALCLFDRWSHWSKCSKPCGGGTAIRKRGKVIGPESCGPLIEVDLCNTKACKRKTLRGESDPEENTERSNNEGVLLAQPFDNDAFLSPFG